MCAALDRPATGGGFESARIRTAQVADAAKRVALTAKPRAGEATQSGPPRAGPRMLPSWATSELVAIALGSRRSGTSMGPSELAVGWKKARVQPNREARTKTAHRPEPINDRIARA